MNLHQDKLLVQTSHRSKKSFDLKSVLHRKLPTTRKSPPIIPVPLVANCKRSSEFSGHPDRSPKSRALLGNDSDTLEGHSENFLFLFLYLVYSVEIGFHRIISIKFILKTQQYFSFRRAECTSCN